jgi:uncharacterized protein with NRDE domain
VRILRQNYNYFTIGLVMCLILFALDAHPAYRLVLAANRDEFTKRPAHAAHWWHYYPNVHGGLDLESGGTWLGITRRGRFAAITNYRDPANILPDAPSRGELTHQYLTHDSISPDDFAATLRRKGRQYNGFNMLWGDVSGETPDVHWYSNYAHDTSPAKVSSGIHGLSNALLNTPWQKVERGKMLLQNALETSSNPFNVTSMLLEILTDSERAPDDHLPDTGVGTELERTLSSMFIQMPDGNYGTRCSTVILVERTGRVHFTEHRFTPAFVDGSKRELLPDATDGTWFDIVH